MTPKQKPMMSGPTDQYFPDTEPGSTPILEGPHRTDWQESLRLLPYFLIFAVALGVVMTLFHLTADQFAALLVTHASVAIVAYWIGQGKL